VKTPTEQTFKATYCRAVVIRVTWLSCKHGILYVAYPVVHWKTWWPTLWRYAFLWLKPEREMQ